MLLRVNLLSMENIGKQLKDFRKKLGLSQFELSQRSNVSQASIARIETNQQKNLKTETIEKLAYALEIPLYQLLEKPEMIREETLPYGDVKMLPVVNLKEFVSKKSRSLLRERAPAYEPVLSQVDNAFFLKAADTLICIPYVNEGDLILIEPDKKINEGDLVLFSGDENFVIGKIFFSLPFYFLQPLNQSLKPLFFRSKNRKKGDIKLFRIREIRKKF